mmetsp:Transcript_1804/g.2769  ORF Transcript_1804/g.2769 Transcript_1804/m.2769 type:complete len:90 (-) Transcript_1804:772-1041(-)
MASLPSLLYHYHLPKTSTHYPSSPLLYHPPQEKTHSLFSNHNKSKLSTQVLLLIPMVNYPNNNNKAHKQNPPFYTPTHIANNNNNNTHH